MNEKFWSIFVFASSYIAESQASTARETEEKVRSLLLDYPAGSVYAMTVERNFEDHVHPLCALEERKAYFVVDLEKNLKMILRADVYKEILRAYDDGREE